MCGELFESFLWKIRYVAFNANAANAGLLNQSIKGGNECRFTSADFCAEN